MNILVLLIVLFFLVRSYKSTVVAMAPLMVFFSMLTIPFFNLVTISLADLLVIFVVVLFPFKCSLKELRHYPFHICTIVMLIAFFFSNYFGYEKRWLLSITKILTIYVYPTILWVCLKRKRFRIFERSMLVFGLTLISYAFYEVITVSNPILEFLDKRNELMNTVMITYDYRFGVKRLQSFLPLFDAFGYTVGSFALVMLYLKLYLKKTLMQNAAIPILAGVMILASFMTGSRAVMAGVFLGLLMFYKIVLKYYKIAIVLLPVFMLFLFSSSFFVDIVRSFSDTESVAGSNSDMRMEQLAISLYYFYLSPIFGNGPTFTFTVARQVDEGLLGAESVWFVYLIEYGVVGCLSLLVTFIYPVIYMKRKKMIQFAFLVLMFVANKSLSSMPGISEGYFLIYIVFLIRVEQFRILLKYLKINYAKVICNNTCI